MDTGKENNMKRKPRWLLSMVGASLLGGCAANPPIPPIAEPTVVPFATIRDAADSADGYYALGRELQRSGKFDDAERAYRLALELEPDHVDARNGLAAISVNRGDVDLALSILGSLAASHADQPHLLANLGYAHYLKGNYFDARVALEQAVALDPANERTRDKLRMVLQKLGAPETEMPPPAEDTPLALESGGMTAEPGIVEVSPGIYELKPAAAVLAADTVAPTAAAPQVLVPSPSAHAESVPPSRVAELVPAIPASTGTPEANAALATRKPSKLEIINGNGVPRLARSLRDLVRGAEWDVVRVANHANFNVPMTRIEYGRGNRQSAEHLVRGLQVTPVYRFNDALGERVRVVLGYDIRSLETLRQRAAEGRLASAD